MSVHYLHYHNTTNEDELLAKYTSTAISQDTKVHVFFLRHPNEMFTPSEILHKVFNESVPITSVRRAMSNLTAQEKLMKTELKRKGIYGRMECCWKLLPFQEEMF